MDMLKAEKLHISSGSIQEIVVDGKGQRNTNSTQNIWKEGCTAAAFDTLEN